LKAGEALHGTTLTPLVGREEEIDLLRRQWDHAKRGDGRVMLLSGEPGIGKSRRTRALLQILRCLKLAMALAAISMAPAAIEVDSAVR
jgi:predicted ATP-dependent serine protease